MIPVTKAETVAKSNAELLAEVRRALKTVPKRQRPSSCTPPSKLKDLDQDALRDILEGLKQLLPNEPAEVDDDVLDLDVFF